MSVNPYAPPRSPVEAQPAQGCWREGKVLVMQPGTALPQRCVKCNDADLQPFKSRWVTWHHPGWYILVLLNIVIYAIVALVVRKRQQVSPGLCSKHLKRRRVSLSIGWAGFLIGLLVIPVGFAQDAPGLVVLGLLGMVVSIIVGIVGARIVYPSRITKEQIRLKGCGEAFLDSLEGQ
jgi:hypothetical protein